MKILVLAETITLNRTSEGICTYKFLDTLRQTNHQVLCLSGDSDIDNINSSHIKYPVPLTKIENYDTYNQKWKKRKTDFSWWLDKLDALCSYMSGFNGTYWRKIQAWMNSIDETIRKEKPDVIFVRGAGDIFTPHLGMLLRNRKIPWIAHYHDPFPISLYPPPYQRNQFIISFLQEFWNRKILENADAITFPSLRLRDWMTKDREDLKEKSFIIPHIGGPINNGELLISQNIIDPKYFSLVHTGTLLGPREPWALIKAFIKFINQDDKKKSMARLYFIGNVNEHHVNNPSWSEALKCENIKIINKRVPQNVAHQMAIDATALILLEANSKISPFFPAKLADYVWLVKPILALSPLESTTVDLLGKNYPLINTPSDVEGICQSLELIWDKWNSEQLFLLKPREDVVFSVSNERTLLEVNKIFEYIARRKK